MGVRLEPSDEYMHELGPEPNFNESMYVNIFDPDNKIGGFFRIGNRANEGYAEMTICLYLPDGQVGFLFKRAEISNNDAFDAGGMRWTMITPFEELRVSYEGKVVLLDDPLEMADPKKAFTENPYAEASIDITFTGQGRPSMFGGEPDEPHETPGEEFARGHYEQLVAGSGRIRVGEREWLVVGFGLRDHSWGPRFWQAPWYYRWLTANVGKDFGFMGSRVARRDGEGTRGGFVWEDGQLHYCDGLELSTTYEGDDQYHEEITAVLRSSRSEKEWRIKGKVMNLIPLRNRRPDPEGEMLVTRISEGMTEWTLGDGRVGYGLSEYLDQIIDGAPVGLAEQRVLTFHLAAREVWEAQRARDAYIPEAFAADGFVHCTDGEDAVIETANRYYRVDPRAYVVLTIAVDALSSEVKYEDADRIFPHVYGPIDIAAVREVRDVRRDADGTFLSLT